MDLDLWFPLIALFSGLFFQFALSRPGLARQIARSHPLKNSLRRIDRMSWILIIVGSLWEIQNLVV